MELKGDQASGDDAGASDGTTPKGASRSKSAARRRPPIVVGGTECRSGKHTWLQIPIAKLQTDTEAALPVQVLHGATDGPTVWMNAAVHGDELNGVEVIRRVLQDIDPRSLAGTIIGVPIVNVFGFLYQSRYLPDRRDLNRSFPGGPRGSLASRLAHIFVTEIVERCSVGIDLHTGSDARTNLPQIRADLKDPETRALAEAFAAPVTLDATLRDGSLRKVARKAGARVLLYEAGEPLRFDRDAIEAGVAGTTRVLASLGMVPAPEGPAPKPTRFMEGSKWVRSGRSGLFHIERHIGDSVAKGDALGFITSPYGKRRVSVRAPHDGVVIGHTTNPLVYQGDALSHVAF